jgi:uncharacterized protein (TIGR02594 family)
LPGKQAGYEWLWAEPGPKMLVEALKLWGTKEVDGKGNNRTIMGWAKEVNTTYPGDATAWCGLFISVAAKRAGWDYYPNGNALWARNWADWGRKVKTAMLGDVLVFPRGEGGHVALYVGEDKTHYHILGGNQSNSVNIVRKAKDPILAIRRAPWRTAQPDNVRVVQLKAGGAPLAGSEA